MAFTPGELTKAEAQKLNDRIRKLEQLVHLRATPPLFLVGGMQQPRLYIDPNALGGTGGETWRAGKIVSRTPGPPISYTVQPLKLDSTGAYVIDGTTVTPCYRMPTKDYDETVLVEIPVDAGVLWREDPGQAGKYQLTPWGGLKKVVKRELVYACSVCEEDPPLSGQFRLKFKRVYRRLRYYARDLRVTKASPPLTEPEGPIDNAITGG